MQPPPQPQPQPYPPQPQPYPPQPYPPQPQQYPQPQPYPPQPYPNQPQPYPQTYPPYPQPAPVAAPVSNKRSAGEMGFLYGTSVAYGIGTGIWIDAVAGISDPGLAFIAPIAFGAAAPVGLYFWDDYDNLHRGVPASIATGLVLGGVEGLAIGGLQWQATGNGGPNTWSFRTQTTVTFLTATGGGVGGYFFGEWLRPDPRSLGFIASGAAWGAISGTLFGAGVTKTGGDWKDPGSVVGFVGFNAGIAATGALSTFYTPSWQSQKYMWLGYAAGTVAASVVYIFYAFSDAPVWHGLIANSLGGLAGVGIAAAVTADLKDEAPAPGQPPRAWSPPFHVGFAPAPGGGMLNAYGMW